MGTRSATIVRQRTHTSKDDYAVDELFRFYRHWDGYPEGHGRQMAEAFVKADKHEGNNNRNWVKQCFAELFAEDCDLEVEPKGVEHGDIEYLYVVEAPYAAYGGKCGVDSLGATIAVYSRSWGDGYEETLAKEPMFEGTPYEYVEWVDGGWLR